MDIGEEGIQEHSQILCEVISRCLEIFELRVSSLIRQAGRAIEHFISREAHVQDFSYISANHLAISYSLTSYPFHLWLFDEFSNTRFSKNMLTYCVS